MQEIGITIQRTQQICQPPGAVTIQTRDAAHLEADGRAVGMRSRHEAEGA